MHFNDFSNVSFHQLENNKNNKNNKNNLCTVAFRSVFLKHFCLPLFTRNTYAAALSGFNLKPTERQTQPKWLSVTAAAASAIAAAVAGLTTYTTQYLEALFIGKQSDLLENNRHTNAHVFVYTMKFYT